MSATGMCPHCGAIVAVTNSLTATHDWPLLTRCAESDRRPLWNGKRNPHFIGDSS